MKRKEMSNKDNFNAIFYIVFLFFSCNRVDIGTTVLEELNGKDENFIIDKFGKPDRTEIVNIFDTTSYVYEYQWGLYDYSGLLSSLDSTLITEYLWETQDSFQVVWLIKINNRLLVLDNLKWSKDIQF
jgi:hypothetical protein